ncbi:DUF1624 domain-containing protein [Silvibacterium sp.]|uniref:DUF1624 domain-containing protein n=1 Tax=Silvibacterium sp. TaxID=1964179 RepID=UPI0039E5CB86
MSTVTHLPPKVSVRQRVASIDILRGLLMVLMALDHTRDYFGVWQQTINPTDPLRSWPAMFFTRWVTHLCAPGFVALAGTSVYLQLQRGKSTGEVRKLLLTRGLWLMLLEPTLISFGWSFNLAPGLQVIWAIGFSMIFLGLLIGLPTAAIGAVGAAIVLLHNLLDGIRMQPGTGIGTLWEFLHQQGPILFHHQFVGLIAYPVVPWIGVICLGYVFGALTIWTPELRRAMARALGVAMLAVFALLRVLHGYGDSFKLEPLGGFWRDTMSFLQVTKYPPSLQYLLVTLGILLLLYSAFDWLETSELLPKLRGVLDVYGRVPFFYYVLHIYLIHLGALLLTAELHLNWRFWLQPGSVFIGYLPHWGFGLPVVYAVWLSAVALLYLPCRWFSRLKARRRDWWLSYL